MSRRKSSPNWRNAVRTVLHKEARAELRDAAVWYDRERSGLGDEFVAEVRSVLKRIAENREFFPVWPNVRAGKLSIRMAVLDRFPYLIAFQPQATRILILAVAHAKRRPLYWIARTKPSVH
jgi:plasmid stabilization system protein ParE